MIIINPDSIFSTGMLMSFAAMTGIWTGNVFYRVIFDRERFKGLPKHTRNVVKKLIGTIIMSVSINIWMLPLVILNFYEVPLLAMFLNLVVTSLLSIVIVAGFLVILGGALVGTESGIVEVFERLLNILIEGAVWMSSQILDLYNHLCRVMVEMKYSVIITGHIEIWEVILYYCLAVMILYWIYCHLKRRQFKEVRRKFIRMGLYMLHCISLSGILIVGVYISSYFSRETVFLDVGQGDGSIIRTSDRRSYIVDCGSSSSSEVGRYTLIPALKYYGMSEIDVIFISHMDSDHMNAVLFLIQNMDKYGIRVKYVAIAEGTSDSENFSALRKAVEASKDTRLIGLKKGQVVDGHFRVIYPEGVDSYEGTGTGGFEGDSEEKAVNQDEHKDLGETLMEKTEGVIVEESGEGKEERNGNDYSLVLDYTDGDLEILYTGDIGKEVEQKLLDEIRSLGRGKTRILKCAHHGSKYSSSQEFIDVFDPDLTVISCGRNNMYGHPSPETLQRFMDEEIGIHRTDVEGAIVIEMK
jgi:competence protein ComEC